MTVPARGQSFTIRSGKHVAAIEEVGARLQSYAVDDKPVVRDMVRPDFSDAFKGSHGQLMMPWVNRTAGGKYEVDDVQFQLPITEAAKFNAIHGFVRFARWEVTDQSESSVTLNLTAHAQLGYPFVFEAQVTYSVAQESGLTVAMSATNVGSRSLPFSMGTHPYLTTGSPHIDSDTLRLDASRYFAVDDKGIPDGQPESLDGTPNDLRAPTSLKELVLDVALCELGRGSNGRATATLVGNDREVSLWMDESFDYVMVFTGDTLSIADERRRSIAIEPMTSAADAYNNGKGLRWLDPGESFSGSWGVTLDQPNGG